MRNGLTQTVKHYTKTMTRKPQGSERERKAATERAGWHGHASVRRTKCKVQRDRV